MTTIHWAFVIDAGVYTTVLVSIVKSSNDYENSYNKALIVAFRLSKYPTFVVLANVVLLNFIKNVRNGHTIRGAQKQFHD